MTNALTKTLIETIRETAEKVTFDVVKGKYKTRETGYKVTLTKCPCACLKAAVNTEKTTVNLCAHIMALAKELNGGQCSFKEYRDMVDHFVATEELRNFQALSERADKVRFKAINGYLEGLEGYAVTTDEKGQGTKARHTCDTQSCSCEAYQFKPPQGVVRLTSGINICKHSLSLLKRKYPDSWQSLIACLQTTDQERP